MLDTIRDLEKNGILNQEIITMLLTKHEYDLISNQAEWVDQRNTYLIPPFYFKQKKVHFPKLPQFQGRITRPSLSRFSPAASSRSTLPPLSHDANPPALSPLLHHGSRQAGRARSRKISAPCRSQPPNLLLVLPQPPCSHGPRQPREGEPRTPVSVQG